MILYRNKKLTANQVAKELLADKLGIAIEFWSEDYSIDFEKLTAKEKQDIQRQATTCWRMPTTMPWVDQSQWCTQSR